MDVQHFSVRQSLFICTADAGGTWEFVVLEDGGCALLRDRQPVTTGDASEPSVQRVLGEFLDHARARRARSAPPPPAEGHAA